MIGTSCSGWSGAERVVGSEVVVDELCFDR
eukprot:SAG11_NODE_213_length_12262_cov_8.391597_5_plen_30_part_00